MEMTPPEQRRPLLEEYPGEIPWRIGRDAAYSEYFAWHLLRWLVETVTGRALRGPRPWTLLVPLGLDDTYIGMTAREYQANLERLGVNHDMKRGWPGVPMLWERTERVCREINPAYGGYSTARDLQRLYSTLLDQLAGVRAAPALPSAETLRTFCSTARPCTYDTVLERECEFGLGFMTGLEAHRFGDRCSDVGVRALRQRRVFVRLRRSSARSGGRCDPQRDRRHRRRVPPPASPRPCDLPGHRLVRP